MDIEKPTTSEETEPSPTRELKDIGELLIESNLITRRQLEYSRALQLSQGKKITDILVEQRFISPEDLTAMLSVQMNVPFIDLTRHILQPQALRLINEMMARKYLSVPLDIVGDSLVVVMADPADTAAINDLTTHAGMQIQPAIGIPGDIREAIDLNYQAKGEIENEVKRLVQDGSLQVESIPQFAEEYTQGTPIIRTVDLLLGQAVRGRASDIHFEPQREGLRVRYRIDGVLQEFMTLPMNIHPNLISRLKILAGMNIAERRLPQDGQLSVTVDNRQVDIRAASIDSAYGEMMVLRILDKSSSLLELPQLGFRSEDLEKYRRMLGTPYGLILVAGPTGSGKTTTLYASINELDRNQRNIVTIEEPIEYYFDDINQIQVNLKAGITFASGLRAMMRLDPDIILVGEMRDNDTANTGVQAALTGHLVLSSIHVNDAASAFYRLDNLGIESFYTSSALVGILAQRMVRRICPHCRTTGDLPPAEGEAYEKVLGEKLKEYYYGSGCNFCGQTGYLGRIGVFEMLTMSDRIRELIVREAPTAAIRKTAMEEGMTPLIRDGMLKVKEGITTPAEIMRNIVSSQ